MCVAEGGLGGKGGGGGGVRWRILMQLGGGEIFLKNLINKGMGMEKCKETVSLSQTDKVKDHGQ